MDSRDDFRKCFQCFRRVPFSVYAEARELCFDCVAHAQEPRAPNPLLCALNSIDGGAVLVGMLGLGAAAGLAQWLLVTAPL